MNRPLRIGSFCSGICAPEVAWRDLGWQPQFFSEIDPFACADGPRYRALGNSMAVAVLRWIGERIRTVEGVA
jgi:site-specific DNA-cytosine methylase